MDDALWAGGPVLSRRPGVFPAGTDAMLLGDFARLGKSDRVLDLGTGSGILMLLLLHGHPGRRAVGMDISPEACTLARENLSRNGLAKQAEVLQGDFSGHRTLLSPGSFDYAVANPPYFSAGSGKQAGGGLALAREEGAGSLDAVCRAAAWGLRWGGDFALCFRPERLADLTVALREAGLEPKRLRLVRHRAGAPIFLLLLEARRGGKPGLRWEPELILQGADGRDSAEYRRIYHLERSVERGD